MIAISRVATKTHTRATALCRRTAISSAARWLAWCPTRSSSRRTRTSSRVAVRMRRACHCAIAPRRVRARTTRQSGHCCNSRWGTDWNDFEFEDCHIFFFLIDLDLLSVLWRVINLLFQGHNRFSLLFLSIYLDSNGAELDGLRSDSLRLSIIWTRDALELVIIAI